MTNHLEYLEIFAEYLISNEILDNFLEACNIAKHDPSDTDCEDYPIDCCFIWSDTKEGHDFWRHHNTVSSELLSKIKDTPTITQKQVIDYLYSINSSNLLVDNLW